VVSSRGREGIDGFCNLQDQVRAQLCGRHVTDDHEEKGDLIKRIRWGRGKTEEQETKEIS
jgi:hypothetical protein